MMVIITFNVDGSVVSGVTLGGGSAAAASPAQELRTNATKPNRSRKEYLENDVRMVAYPLRWVPSEHFNYLNPPGTKAI
jgi:hypothetical protein